MKNRFLITFILLLSFITAQSYAQTNSIIYLRLSCKKNPCEYVVTSKDSAKYYILSNSNDSINGLATLYYLNGNKKEEANFKNKRLNGFKYEWNVNGIKMNKYEYRDGDLISRFDYEYNDDSTYFEDKFIDNGDWRLNFVEGRKINFNGETIYTYDTLEVEPRFIGGLKAMSNYINKKMETLYVNKYTRNIEGKVKAKILFTIDKEGNVINPSIQKGTGNINLDNIAIEVISGMPKWQPATFREQPVKMRLMLPISFEGYQ